MVLIAARHGESSKLKVKKVKPARALPWKKSVITYCHRAASVSVASAILARTPIVLTMPSFATKPEREDATACQLPKPSGAKIGARKVPMIARKEASISSTMPKAPFSTPNVARNHITIQQRNRIVPAFFKKLHTRSHT